MSFPDINLYLVRGCSHSFPYFPMIFRSKPAKMHCPLLSNHQPVKWMPKTPEMMGKWWSSRRRIYSRASLFSDKMCKTTIYVIDQHLSRTQLLNCSSGHLHRLVSQGATSLWRSLSWGMVKDWFCTCRSYGCPKKADNYTKIAFIADYAWKCYVALF